MTSDPEHTLQQLFLAQERTKRWWAESEAASSKHDGARIREHMATLLSRHDPLQQLGWERAKVAAVFNYLIHGDLKRLNKDLGIVE